jgi:hypothetical protein
LGESEPNSSIILPDGEVIGGVKVKRWGEAALEGAAAEGVPDWLTFSHDRAWWFIQKNLRQLIC